MENRHTMEATGVSVEFDDFDMPTVTWLLGNQSDANATELGNATHRVRKFEQVMRGG